MATNRDLLKEAIADAKAVKETAIANAKAALEEAFTPFLKEKLAAKINEMDEEMDEEMYDEAEEMDEMKKSEEMDEMEEMDEVSLDELLSELEEETEDENMMKEEAKEEDESLYEAKEEKEEEEEEMSIEDMSEDDLKSFIEDVIKDMVAAGELEAGHEGMENEEGAEEGAEEMEPEMGAEEGEEELDEEINIDEILAEAEEEEEEELDEIFGMGEKAKEKTFRAEIAKYITAWKGKVDAPTADEIEKMVADAKADKFEGKVGAKDKKMIYRKSSDIKWGSEFAGGGTGGAGKAGSGTYESKISELNTQLEEAYEAIETLKSELHEINLLNAKLLYTNKIFRNKSLTESQKIKVLTAFDKAASKKEVELVYETLQESLKVSTTKAPIKESLGSASKVLGNASAKPIIEVDNQFARWQQLAGINKK